MTHPPLTSASQVNQVNQIPLRATMSAIVTTTSQTVETRIICNGNEVATKYFDNLNQALQHLDTIALDSIEIEDLDI